MKKLEKFLTYLGKQEYQQFTRNQIDAHEEFEQYYDESFLKENYSGVVLQYLLHNIIVDKFMKSYNCYLAKLMFEPLIDKYLFMDYIKLITNNDKIEVLHNIEKQRDLALLKNWSNFEKVIHNYKSLYNQYLGINNIKYYEFMNQIDYQDVNNRAEKYIQETERDYFEFLVNIKDYFYKDVKDFQKTELLSLFWRTLDLKIDSDIIYSIFSDFKRLYSQEVSISIERCDTDGINGNACCIPIEIPNDIRIILPKETTLATLKSFLHELGHALSLAAIDAENELFYKLIPNDIVQEIYAVTFEKLFLNDLFMQEYNIILDKSIVQILKFHGFYHSRLMAAKTIFQYEVFTNNNISKSALFYEQLFSDVLMVPIKPVKSIMDIEFERNAIQYFLANEISEKLITGLVKNCGEAWYKSKNAIVIQKSLWNRGGKLNSDEIEGFTTSMAMKEEL